MNGDPSGIMALSTAYWGSQVLHTANRWGLFDLLAKQPLNAHDAAERLDADPRTTALFLNALVALGLLDKNGDKYANSAASAAFLVAGQPGYLGNALRYADNLYGVWGNLQSTIEKGVPGLEASEYTGSEERLTKDFVYGMHDRALGVGRVLAELVDLAECERLLDVGGGPGTYAALFLQRYPQLRAVVLDLPGVVAHASEILADMGVDERVQMLPGDFHATEFPRGMDAVLISGVLHRELETGSRTLIDKAWHSLNSNGLLIVSDVFTNAGGAGPEFATLFGLNMALTAEHGGVHAQSDMSGWMSARGFEVEAPIAFPGPMPHSVIVGRKP